MVDAHGGLRFFRSRAYQGARPPRPRHPGERGVPLEASRADGACHRATPARRARARSRVGAACDTEHVADISVTSTSEEGPPWNVDDVVRWCANGTASSMSPRVEIGRNFERILIAHDSYFYLALSGESSERVLRSQISVPWQANGASRQSRRRPKGLQYRPVQLAADSDGVDDEVLLRRGAKVWWASPC